MTDFPPVLTHPSYNDIEKGCARIALDLTMNNDHQPEVIVGLTRGGLFPAVILSHMLNLPMNAVSYSSKRGAGDNRNHINILPEIPSNNFESGTGRLPKDPCLLLVDDIADSGNTLKEVASEYRSRGHEVITAVLYWKESSIFQPDFFLLMNQVLRQLNHCMIFHQRQKR